MAKNPPNNIEGRDRDEESVIDHLFDEPMSAEKYDSSDALNDLREPTGFKKRMRDENTPTDGNENTPTEERPPLDGESSIFTPPSPPPIINDIKKVVTSNNTLHPEHNVRWSQEMHKHRGQEFSVITLRVPADSKWKNKNRERLFSATHVLNALAKKIDDSTVLKTVPITKNGEKKTVAKYGNTLLLAIRAADPAKEDSMRLLENELPTQQQDGLKQQDDWVSKLKPLSPPHEPSR